MFFQPPRSGSWQRASRTRWSWRRPSTARTSRPSASPTISSSNSGVPSQARPREILHLWKQKKYYKKKDTKKLFSNFFCTKIDPFSVRLKNSFYSFLTSKYILLSCSIVEYFSCSVIQMPSRAGPSISAPTPSREGPSESSVVSHLKERRSAILPCRSQSLAPET